MMLRARTLVTASLWLGASFAGCASSEASPIAILDGVASDAASVVVVSREHPSDPMVCTAFLVAPDLLLTARHCVASVAGRGCAVSALDVLEGATFAAYEGASVDASSTPRAIVAARVEPGSVGQSMCGNDVAVLQLAEPLRDVTPLTLRLEGPPIVGEAAVPVGYGYATPGDDTTLYTRRMRTDAIVATLGPASTVSGDVRLTEAEWTLSVGPCAGDSGGPALDGTGAVIGVMSRGVQASCTDMIYGRIDAHAAWLSEEIAASYARTGTSPPDDAAIAVDDAGAPDGGAVVDAGVAGGSGGCTASGSSRPGALAWLALVAGVVVSLRRRSPR